MQQLLPSCCYGVENNIMKFRLRVTQDRTGTKCNISTHFMSSYDRVQTPSYTSYPC